MYQLNITDSNIYHITKHGIVQEFVMMNACQKWDIIKRALFDMR